MLLLSHYILPNPAGNLINALKPIMQVHQLPNKHSSSGSAMVHQIYTNCIEKGKKDVNYVTTRSHFEVCLQILTSAHIYLCIIYYCTTHNISVILPYVAFCPRIQLTGTQLSSHL